MKIVSHKISRYYRKFTEPLSTSKGIYTQREGYVISLKTSEGCVGYGEAAPLHGYSVDDEKTIESAFAEITHKFINTKIESNLSSISGFGGDSCSALTVLRFALESALYDAAAKEAEKPLCKWLNTNALDKIPVNYLVGDKIENWNTVLSEINNKGYQTIKIKVGRDPYKDIERIKLAREKLGNSIAIVLDANQGWTYNQAVYVLKALADQNIKYVEEPIGDPDEIKLRGLREETDCRIALDESLETVFSHGNAIREKMCDVIIIKPARIGSYAGVIEIYNLARLYNCLPVLTSTLETEIGIASQLQLAAALGQDLPSCGFDTLRLYDDANEMLSTVRDGAIQIPLKNGIGYAPIE